MSFLKGLIVALIYTLVNSEVQNEISRSMNQCLLKKNARCEQGKFFRNYTDQLDNQYLYSFRCQVRSTSVQYRQRSPLIRIKQYHHSTCQHKSNSNNQNHQDSINAANTIG